MRKYRKIHFFFMIPLLLRAVPALGFAFSECNFIILEDFLTPSGDIISPSSSLVLALRGGVD